MKHILTNKKVLSAFFVHCFVDRRILLSVGRRSGRHRLKRILANFHLQGIVKFLVDIYDETDETVGIATILTMVKKLDQA